MKSCRELIVESTIVFKLAGVCLAHIIFRNKPHKLIVELFIASNNGIRFQLKFPWEGAAPSILRNIPCWLIVENILPGAGVIPNISCEELHRLIVMSDAPPNFERELAFDNKASFNTSNIFSQKSKLIGDSIPSYEGYQRAALKLIVICTFDLNVLIKLILVSCHQQHIVAYVNTNSKIYLIFGQECRTFCEGEWEQQIGNISLAGYIGLVGLIELVKPISFIGYDGIIGLIGLNGFVGQI